MSNTVAYALTVLLGYLLGSIPTGFLVAKAKGIDIRTVGSGNIGATNAFRILGKGAGIFVLLADACKGFVACEFLPMFVPQIFPAADVAPAHIGLVAGVAAILGHNYTCWLYFKGGKGIATSAGVLFTLAPAAAATILAVWIILFFATKYVSLASIAASATLPFAQWFWSKGQNPEMIYIFAGLAALAIYKHKANIQRLLAGTEGKIGAKKKEPVT